MTLNPRENGKSMRFADVLFTTPFKDHRKNSVGLLIEGHGGTTLAYIMLTLLGSIALFGVCIVTTIRWRRYIIPVGKFGPGILVNENEAAEYEVIDVAFTPNA